MVNVLGATGSLLPVLLSSNARADKPPVAPTGLCDVQHFPLLVVTSAAHADRSPRCTLGHPPARDHGGLGICPLIILRGLAAPANRFGANRCQDAPSCWRDGVPGGTHDATTEVAAAGRAKSNRPLRQCWSSSRYAIITRRASDHATRHVSIAYRPQADNSIGKTKKRIRRDRQWNAPLGGPGQNGQRHVGPRTAYRTLEPDTDGPASVGQAGKLAAGYLWHRRLACGLVRAIAGPKSCFRTFGLDKSGRFGYAVWRYGTGKNRFQAEIGSRALLGAGARAQAGSRRRPQQVSGPRKLPTRSRPHRDADATSLRDGPYLTETRTLSR